MAWRGNLLSNYSYVLCVLCPEVPLTPLPEEKTSRPLSYHQWVAQCH